MIKKVEWWLGLFLAVFCLTACTAQKKESGGERGVQGDERSEVEQRVKAIYDDVLRIPNSEEDFSGSKHFDEKYCSRAWKEKLREVSDREAEAPGDIGCFDFDYWVMGQDIDSNISVRDIKVVDIGESAATVELVLHNFSDQTIRLEMVKEAGSWYIDNFIHMGGEYDGGDANLLQRMDEYLNE